EGRRATRASSGCSRNVSRERGERLHRGGLLRRLLALPNAAPARPPADRDLGDEALLVVGAALLDERVRRGLTEEPLRELLELRLVVALADGRVLAEVGRELRLDHGARRLVPGVEVDRAEDGLVGGGEDRFLVAAAALLLALA